MFAAEEREQDENHSGLTLKVPGRTPCPVHFEDNWSVCMYQACRKVRKSEKVKEDTAKKKQIQIIKPK